MKKTFKAVNVPFFLKIWITALSLSFFLKISRLFLWIQISEGYFKTMKNNFKRKMVYQQRIESIIFNL